MSDQVALDRARAALDRALDEYLRDYGAHAGAAVASAYADLERAQTAIDRAIDDLDRAEAEG